MHMGSWDIRSAVACAAHTQSAGTAGIQNPGQWYKTFKIQKGAFNYNLSLAFHTQRCVWKNLDA